MLFFRRALFRERTGDETDEGFAGMVKALSTSAVILAGGLGTRLRSIVTDRPKALAPVCGRPFLAFLFEQLSLAGFEHAILCTGYMGESISRAFGSRYGALKIDYSREPEPLGTAGSLRRALRLIRSNPALVMNGDSYCKADLGAFLKHHLQSRVSASIVVLRKTDATRYGRVVLGENDRILEFTEKSAQGSSGYVNAGIYLLDRAVIQSIPDERMVSLERDVFPSLVGNGLGGYAAAGPFLDIGTPESFAAAQSFFAEWPDPGIASQRN